MRSSANNSAYNGKTPNWVDGSTFVTTATDINVTIPRALAEVYDVDPQDLTTVRRVVSMKVWKPEAPANYIFQWELEDGQVDQWFFQRPNDQRYPTEWEVHAHLDNRRRILPL